jgi:hypothetical protein
VTKALSKLVDDFTVQMKAKLDIKHRNGWTGWDNMDERDVRYRLGEHAIRAMLGDGDQEVDIANFCAFLWYAKKRHAKGR